MLNLGLGLSIGMAAPVSGGGAQGATTVLTSAAGTSKNSNITVSGTPALSAAIADSTGAPNMVRATQSASGKKQFEITMTAINTTNSILIGIDDGTTSLGPTTSTVPGKANNAGIVLEYATYGWQIDKGAAGVQSSLSATTFAVGSVLTCEFDTVAGTVSFYHNGVQVGTTITGLGTISTAAWAVMGDDGHNFSFNANFGQSAFTHALGTGYTAYG